MLLEPIIMEIINLLNLKVESDKVFLNYVIDYGNWFHFLGPKKESEFWAAVVFRNGCFNLR